MATTKASVKPVMHVNSLASFETADVEARLEFADRVELVPMRTLSYGEFQRIGWQVRNPTPPISGVDGSRRPVFDYNDATYQQQMQEAERQRALRRLLAALNVEVPGATDDEKIAYLQGLDANYLRLLISVVGQLVTEGEARIEAKAAAFQQG